MSSLFLVIIIGSVDQLCSAALSQTHAELLRCSYTKLVGKGENRCISGGIARALCSILLSPQGFIIIPFYSASYKAIIRLSVKH